MGRAAPPACRRRGRRARPRRRARGGTAAAAAAAQPAATRATSRCSSAGTRARRCPAASTAASSRHPARASTTCRGRPPSSRRAARAAPSAPRRGSTEAAPSRRRVGRGAHRARRLALPGQPVLVPVPVVAAPLLARAPPWPPLLPRGAAAPATATAALPQRQRRTAAWTNSPRGGDLPARNSCIDNTKFCSDFICVFLCTRSACSTQRIASLKCVSDLLMLLR